MKITSSFRMQIIVLKVKEETYPQFWELKIVYLGIFYFQLMTKLLQLSCFRWVFLKHSSTSRALRKNVPFSFIPWPPPVALLNSKRSCTQRPEQIATVIWFFFFLILYRTESNWRETFLLVCSMLVHFLKKKGCVWWLRFSCHTPVFFSF